MVATVRAAYADRVDESTPGEAIEQNVAASVGRVRRVGRFLRRLGPAGPLLLVASSLPTLGAALLLGALTVVAPVLRQTPTAPAACAVGFTVLGGLSVLPTYALSILAGWSFGFAVGFPTSLAGIGGAAAVAYAIARRASGRRLLAIIDEKPTWRAVHHALVCSGFWRTVWIIALMRVAPFPPFAITNLVLGAAHVKLSRFTVGTLLGMAPQAGFLSLAAAGLHQVSFRAGNQPLVIGIGIVGMIAVVVVIGRLARQALESVAREEEQLAPEALAHDPRDAHTPGQSDAR